MSRENPHIDNARKLIEELHREKLKWCNQEDSRNVLSVIKESIFDEKTHFIIELIQNANDCKSDEIIFNLREDKLIITNTGEPFNEKNVKALSSIGRSTKKEGDVGFFGIGFKSVFLVTDKPEVHSGPYHFCYDAKTLIVPELISNPNWKPESGTIFVLPIKEESHKKNIGKQLKEFDGSVLLFLKHLKKISIEDITFEIKKGTSENSFELFKNGKKISYWKRYSKILNIPLKEQKALQEERGRRWSSKKREEIVIAFQVNEEGVPIKCKGKLFAFFPTKVLTGLSFNIQADFLVPLSRTTLKEAEGLWNQWIFKNIYRPIAELVKDFKKSNSLKTSFYQLLPKKDDLQGDYLKEVKEGIDEYIRKNLTVYTSSKKWVKPSEALIPFKGMQSLFEEKDLKELFSTKKHYISEGIIGGGLGYLKEHVNQFTCENLIDKVSQKTGWLEKQSLNWLINFYALLWDWVCAEENEASWKKHSAIVKIRQAPIFLSESKKAVAIETQKRKLYILGQKQASFFELFKNEYELLNPSLYKKILSESAKSRIEKSVREKAKLLIEEVVPLLSHQEIVKNIIKPAFSDWKKHNDDKLFKYTDFIRRFIEKPEEVKDIFSLREEGSTRNYLKPENLFIPPEYGVSQTLKKLFEGEKASFVSIHYIQKLLKRESEKSKEDIASWKNFFKKLGVNECPRIIIEYEDSNEDKIVKELKQYHPDSKIKNSNWRYKKKDFEFMQPFSKIIDSLDEKIPGHIEKAKLIVRVINDNWDYYKKCLDSYYRYHTLGAIGGESEEKLSPSRIALIIKNKAWVPTQSGTGLFKPSNVALNLQEIKAAMGDQAEYVDGVIDNKDLIKFAGFIDKPSFKAALNHLKGLVDKKSNDYDSFRRSYIFFRDLLLNPESLSEEKETVRRTFKSEPLIFIPELKNRPYRKCKEVVWSGPAFLNDFKPNLGRYFDLENFFVDNLGVDSEPSTKDYVDFLIYFSQKDNLASSEKEALLSTYGKLDAELTRKHEGQQQLWKNLRENGKVLCLNKDWVPFSKKIYYNNSEELYNIFKDSLNVIYLDPRKGLPTRFLEEFGINGLKQAVQEIAPEIDAEVIKDADLEETEKIRTLVPYICGFIKKNNPDYFERLKDEGVFHQLTSVSVKIVGNIETVYEVEGLQKPNPEKKKSFYDSSSNTLYVIDGVIGCEDIGLSLSNALNHPGMVDFILRLIPLDEITRQNMIKNRKIDWVEVPSESSKPDTDQIGDGKEKDEDKSEDEDGKHKKPENSQKGKTQSPYQKPFFNVQEYLKGITDSLDSIPTALIKEEDLQNSTDTSKRKATGGGGGLYSGLTDEQKKNIGTAAEKIVYEKEKHKLKKLFKKSLITKDLSKKVDYIAERNDSAGYDIQSWDENGNKIYIEVKGTTDEESMRFPISCEEFKKAEEKGDSYFIYRVLDIKYGTTPKIKIIQNPFKLWRKDKLKIITKQLLMTAELNRIE